MKLKHPLAWLSAVSIALSGVIAGDLFSDNIATFLSQHHWDNFIPRGIGWLEMFIHAWWGGFTLGALASAFLLLLYFSIADFLAVKDLAANPIKIDFDLSNPNNHFWSQRRVPEENQNYYSEIVTEFRVKLTNRTPKTIENVRINLLFQGGRSETVAFPNFTSDRFDLHPNAEVYVPIYSYDEMFELNSENDPDYQSRRTFKLQITAPNMRMCECTVQIDVSKTPEMTLLKR